MSEDRPGASGIRATQRDWNLPWAEPWTAGEPERAELAAAFGAAIRKTGSLMQLMSQAAADRIGINATDLNCLNILSFSGQMTAGELARATGLTTASITGVVDRLEEAGYVRRERDPARPAPGGHPPGAGGRPARRGLGVPADDARLAGDGRPLQRR